MPRRRPKSQDAKPGQASRAWGQVYITTGMACIRLLGLLDGLPEVLLQDYDWRRLTSATWPASVTSGRRNKADGDGRASLMRVRRERGCRRDAERRKLVWK